MRAGRYRVAENRAFLPQAVLCAVIMMSTNRSAGSQPEIRSRRIFSSCSLMPRRIRQLSSSLKRKIVWAEDQIRATQGGNLELWGPKRFFSGSASYLICLSVIHKSHLFIPISFIRLSLVLQRYKSSSKTMQPVDDTPVKDHFLGGYRHGRQNDYENQTGIDAIPAPV
jgi:hypothetical protein